MINHYKIAVDIEQVHDPLQLQNSLNPAGARPMQH